jgi:1-acyl-sn-glycerol-3-phosphate acyltransferase
MHGAAAGARAHAPTGKEPARTRRAAGTRYSPLAMATFEAFFLPWRRRRLAPPVVLGLPAALPHDRPLLIVSNHTSWWDGFLLRDLHRTLRPRASFSFVMTEHELARRRWFRWLGALPVDAASPASILRMVRSVVATCTARSDSVVVFFPQGRIWPAWRRPLGFQRGIDVLLRALPPAYLLPVGLHIEPLTGSAPQPFVTAGAPLRWPEDAPTGERLERLVTEQLDHVLRALAEHGEAAPALLRNAQ